MKFRARSYITSILKMLIALCIWNCNKHCFKYVLSVLKSCMFYLSKSGYSFLNC